ncbi:hypothetical protein Pint_26786 [Pistacia integerrima]|uniref:Uncharacterized protein n=1 Tax=Pistacia integerrima TaxID=434235 RepID=A0ACC0YRW3_9ROSI|nr:hypothetical protein Pint_26786 [Pistacia integerrima]
MSWTWTSLALVALVFFLQAFLLKKDSKTKRLPPGPRGFPIFGSLHLLGKFPHKDFHKLAKKYGSIMFLRLGSIPTIAISSPHGAEQFLKTEDLVFASRHPVEAAKHIAYGQKNKLELDLLIEHIKEAAAAGVAVDLGDKVSSLSSDLTCRMVFGKKYADVELNERGFKTVIQEGTKLAAIPNLGDYIPQIASLDLQGLTKFAKAIAKVFDDFLERAIDEHVDSKDENRTKDFVDVMLSFMGSEETEYKIEREHVKAMLLVSNPRIVRLGTHLLNLNY